MTVPFRFVHPAESGYQRPRAASAAGAEDAPRSLAISTTDEVGNWYVGVVVRGYRCGVRAQAVGALARNPVVLPSTPA